jgi:hypothetical protein
MRKTASMRQQPWYSKEVIALAYSLRCSLFSGGGCLKAGSVFIAEIMQEQALATMCCVLDAFLQWYLA